MARKAEKIVVHPDVEGDLREVEDRDIALLKQVHTSGLLKRIADLKKSINHIHCVVCAMRTHVLTVQTSAAVDTSPALTPVLVTIQVGSLPGNFPVSAPVYVQIAAFDDIHATVPAANAVLQNATVGTIVAGEGTAATKVLTDATGKAVIELTDATAESVHVASGHDFLGPALSCLGITTVTFS